MVVLACEVAACLLPSYLWRCVRLHADLWSCHRVRAVCIRSRVGSIKMRWRGGGCLRWVPSRMRWRWLVHVLLRVRRAIAAAVRHRVHLRMHLRRRHLRHHVQLRRHGSRRTGVLHLRWGQRLCRRRRCRKCAPVAGIRRRGRQRHVAWRAHGHAVAVRHRWPSMRGTLLLPRRVGLRTRRARRVWHRRAVQCWLCMRWHRMRCHRLRWEVRRWDRRRGRWRRWGCRH